MLESVQHPRLLRWADAAHARLEGGGKLLLRLAPSSLKEAARKRARLRDFGSDDFEEGLSVLCKSAEEDANLNLFGRLMVHRLTVSALVHRLRRVELRRTRPALFERPLNRPVIVLGLPRSGTTHLHRLLALGPDARALSTWEVREPLPGGGPDLRRLRTRALVRHIRRAAPALDTKHHIDTDAAEECIFLLEDSLRSCSYWMFFPVYGYLAWLLQQDAAPAYQAYREYLQIFQAQTPSKRLVLKAPAHAGNLEALLKAVPEATIVHTHRDPVPVVGSANSLFHTIFSLTTRRLDHAKFCRVNLELLGRDMDRSMAARERVDPDHLIDSHYRELHSDPMGTVARVCERTGLTFDEAAVRERVKSRTQGRFGRHEYSLEEAGLTEEEVKERFAEYRARFDLP